MAEKDKNKRMISIFIDVKRAEMSDVFDEMDRPRMHLRVWTFANGNMVDGLIHPDRDEDKLRKAVKAGEVWVEVYRHRQMRNDGSYIELNRYDGL
jgi:hypothetical protein